MDDPNDPRRRRLKLFLSVDIVGSTAYKQPFDIFEDLPEKASNWAPAIALFYSTVTSAFRTAWDSVYPDADANPVDDHGELNPQRPRLWKTVGDEVIFWQELSHERDIWQTFACWLQMIAKVRREFQSKRYNNLDVKSSAWLAEFPVRNKALPMHLENGLFGPPGSVTIERKSTREQLRSFYEHKSGLAPVDFIGPGIDVGFRLSEFSSAKKMAVSLDVAYLMAVSALETVEGDKTSLVNRMGLIPATMGTPSAAPQERTLRQALRIFYSGRAPLKGVLGGMRYPRFWINTLPHGTLEFANDNLYARRREPVGWDDLRIFCESVYRDRQGYLIPPYFTRQDSATSNDVEKYRKAYEHCRIEAIDYLG